MWMELAIAGVWVLFGFIVFAFNRMILPPVTQFLDSLCRNPVYHKYSVERILLVWPMYIINMCLTFLMLVTPLYGFWLTTQTLWPLLGT